MKSLIVLGAAFATLAAAQPHRHAHLHNHVHERRIPTPVVDVVDIPGPTVVMYSLNDRIISEAEVMEGINNGTLVWASGGGVEQDNKVAATSQVTSSVAAPTTTSTTSSSPAAVTTTTSSAEPTTSSAAPTTTKSTQAPSTTTASTEPVSTEASVSSSGSGVDSEFPSGSISCSDFPSSYGAIAVEYMGLGGWIGIQNPGSSSSAGYSDIETVDAGSCSGSDCCGEGMYCSYACPAGYQKSQWPSTQGLTGQSVGGLLCQDGKLHLTNSDLSNNLCIPGAAEVTILVDNQLSSNVAVCRTDYPGTESETVPLNVAGGSTDNLTCPDAANYYTWGGGSTSAQYYVNPAGVGVSDACTWGSDANPWGNFAPLNLGVGYSNGAAWLAIFQNAPTTDAKLDFSVEITGDGLRGACRYRNGQYCSGTDYSDCSSTDGCTVSLTSGTATFVFSDA